MACHRNSGRAKVLGILGVLGVTTGLLTALISGCFPGSELLFLGTLTSANSAANARPSILAISPESGPAAGGTKITIQGERFKEGSIVLLGGFLASETTVVSDAVMTTVTPAQPAGKVDLIIREKGGASIIIPEAFEYLAADAADAVPGGPRLVSAVAKSNTEVLVTFNEPVNAAAETPSNYVITQNDENPDSGRLPVLAAAIGSEPNQVTLTTVSQGEVVYILVVSGIQDLFGNPLEPPSMFVDPTRTEFSGIPPTESGTDTDGDGLSDHVEAMGWTVTVTLINGETRRRDVSSDPRLVDTDGDGLTDAEEKSIGTDPRAADTDGDMVQDYEEYNEWFSEPTAQDTDGDGFSDSLDIYFKTSPVLADTDGDQWTDEDEIVRRNRNPRLADIPLPQVKVGTIGVYLKETYSYTDELGETHTQEHSSSATLNQSTSQTNSTSDTRSSENEDKYSQELSTTFNSGGGADQAFPGITITGKVGFEQTRQRGYSSTVSHESATSASKEFQNSVSDSTSFSENRSVTRTIEDADLVVDVTLTNVGDVAFTLSDLELAVLLRDPIRRENVPLGTLLSERALNNGEDVQYFFGPFDQEKGPFIFKDVQLFPNVAEEIFRSPSAVIVKIANFSIHDESGRNFAFASQDINDRTAGLIINYGNGVVESYRVATASKFDLLGHPLGISMQTALSDIIGIARAPGDDPSLPAGADLNDPAIRDTYGSNVNEEGREVLTRVRGVQTGFDPVNRQRKFWAIISSVDVPEGTNFSDIMMRSGEDYSLCFVADTDGDGLFASIEYLYGSSDDNPDTDGDGISDYDEVRTGWTVAIPGNEHQVFSDPTRVDSDGDGLTDPEEKALQSDPRKLDTDEDGLTDFEEVTGYEVTIFDGDEDDSNNPVLLVAPYTSLAIIDGGNGLVETTVAAGSDDEQVYADGATVAAGLVIIRPGPNHVLDTEPAGDDIVAVGARIVDGGNCVVDTDVDPASDDIQLIASGLGVGPEEIIAEAGLNEHIDTLPTADDREHVGHLHYVASDPLRRDTDADSLLDGREVVLGSDPNDPNDAGTVVDTDLDGLMDGDEIHGWTITVNGVQTLVASNPNVADTDRDGVPDLLERMLGLNPNTRDTDGDTISDKREYDPDDPMGYFDPDVYDEFLLQCSQAYNCAFTPAGSPTGTDPRKRDTDGDSLDDNVELNSPWTVQVFGETPYSVYSDPTNGDADMDGLTDTEERANGTDPNNADTDGDSVTDGREVLVTGTNPLRKDKKVTFTYTRVLVAGDCDPGEDGGQWDGFLRLTLPNGSTASLYDMSGCDNVDEGSNCDVDESRTFILNEGESFTAYSTDIKEVDSGSGDESLGSFSDQFDYYTLPNTASWDLDGGDWCDLTIYASIKVH